MIGRHLSGANFYDFKVYSQQLTELSNTAPDGQSPLPKLGTPYFGDVIRFFATGSTVAGGTPTMHLMDDDFNVITTYDLTAITGYSAGRFDGFVVIGRDSQDRYILAGTATNDVPASATATKVMVVALDEQGNYEVLAQQEISDVLYGQRASYNDELSLPVIDVKKKVLYLHAANRAGSHIYVYKIDFSDLDIEEYNDIPYRLQAPKIPTILSLTVKAL